jgi:hypothetical protein
MHQTIQYHVSEGEEMANFLSMLLKKGIRYVVERDGDHFFITLCGF